MIKKDKRIDSYIAKSATFAQPILKHMRQLIHKADPGVQETIKWGFPHFEHNGIVCSMASFKEHCTFLFWKASLMSDSCNIFKETASTAMGQLGRIEKISDLPPDKVLVEYLKEAVELNKNNIKMPSRSGSSVKKELKVPGYFLKALKKNKDAVKNFENFSYSHKKEYVEWITEAKTEATRERRIETAVEWISEGKQRMWKYVK
jgi:uncharacterized protein YdeI (YjbR/CyaY-like superfamily)